MLLLDREFRIVVASLADPVRCARPRQEPIPNQVLAATQQPTAPLIAASREDIARAEILP